MMRQTFWFGVEVGAIFTLLLVLIVVILVKG